MSDQAPGMVSKQPAGQVLPGWVWRLHQVLYRVSDGVRDHSRDGTTALASGAWSGARQPASAPLMVPSAISGDRGFDAPRVPHDADWSWRPGLWCRPCAIPDLAIPQDAARLNKETTLFHDAPDARLALCQTRQATPGGGARSGLGLEIRAFAGSYLSLANDLPPQAARGLSREHLIQLDIRLHAERPLEIYARLNLQCGPNNVQLLRGLPRSSGDLSVAFDLAYARFNPRRLDRLWLDVIFRKPSFTTLHLEDLALHRRPRAAF